MTGKPRLNNHYLPPPAGYPTPEPKPTAPRTPQEILDAAEKRCPGNPFVAGCRKFLAERGFLSAKQLKSLEAVQAPATDLGYGEDGDPDAEAFSEEQALWGDLLGLPMS